MILRNKLNQVCEFRARVDADAYGDSVFAEGVGIVCRREDVQRLVFDRNGREVMSSARYFLERRVEPGDMLDGRIVINVVALTGMFGTEEGFEASCQ